MDCLTTVEGHWEEYTRGIPRGFGTRARALARRAFYAGVLSTMSHLSAMVEVDGVTEDEGAERIEAWWRECEEFFSAECDTPDGGFGCGPSI